MPPPDLLRHLEVLHARAFGWALVCCGRDRHRAADVLQTSYARILAGEARWRDEGELAAFLFGIVRRVALEEHRRTRREDVGREPLAIDGGATEHLRDHGPSTLDRLEDVEVQRALRRALAELPQRQREVLHLTFYQGLSIAGAAAVLEIGVGSARQHYARGKATLREHCAPLVRDSH